VTARGADLRPGGWRSLRWGDLAVGLLLLAACAAKAWELWTVPGTRFGAWGLPRWLLACGCGVELALGLALALGLLPRLARALGLALFLAFAAMTAALLAQGAPSCGCFGRLAVPPGITLALDLLAAAALAWELRRGRPGPQRPRVAAALAVAAVLAGAAAAGLLAWHRPSLASLLAQAQPKAGSALPGPLAGEALGRGSWWLLFYRSSCPECRTHLRAWLARMERESEAGLRRWALVDAAPGEEGGDLVERLGGTRLPRFQADLPLLTTPLAVEVRDGVVRATADAPTGFARPPAHPVDDGWEPVAP
jgi:hypothetical protein